MALVFTIVFTMLLPVLLLPGFAYLHQQSPGQTAGCQPVVASVRLPSYVVPESYSLFLNLNSQQLTFNGRESIDLEVKQPCSQIILHSVDLKIASARLARNDPASNVAFTGKVLAQRSAETIKISWPRQIEVGKYQLQLCFSGKINNQLQGLYWADCKKASKVTGRISASRISLSRICATQFEPTFARQMFPCFDEPACKAVFTLSVEIDSNLTAISNTPIEKTTAKLHCRRKTVFFLPTIKMSTYLLALFVGPFEGSAPIVVHGVPIRVWTVRGKLDLCAYAQKTAARILPYLEGYFGCPYPERKLDLIALPEFEAGAMENLGAISFREEYLLFAPGKDSFHAEMNIASIIAHEMSHMWFGDLVTMQWWADIWLNEGFATWMSVKVLEDMKPQWRNWDRFSLERMEAMSSDALVSTHPIHTQARTPMQAFELFDEITYEKGAAVIRMLETYVGEKVFQRGVQTYIQDHKWGNATTIDLWDAIGKKANIPVSLLMNTWVYQAGFPGVSVTPEDGDHLLISQARFLTKRPSNPGKKSNQIWQIPVGLRVLRARATDASPDDYLLLSDRSRSVPISSAEEFIVNPGGNGYFRTIYADVLMTRLSGDNLQKLGPVERLQLLSDEWACTFAGLASVDKYLALLKSFKGESDPLVIQEVVHQLDRLDELINDNSQVPLAVFVREILGPAKSRFTWRASPDDSDLTKQARNNVIRALGTIGEDSKTIEEARSFFLAYLKDARSIDPNLVEPVITICAYNGDIRTYAELKNCWQRADSPEAEKRALLALADFREADLIQKTLLLSISQEVKLQDAPYILAGLFSTRAARHEALNFLESHSHDIRSRYAPMMMRQVVHAASSLAAVDDQERLRRFLTQHPIAVAKMETGRTLERVDNNVAFVRRNQRGLQNWLEKNIGEAGQADARTRR
jgi:puromycin-sensitive aminopeptidase